MKVRVERIRRGRRTAEVEYVETSGPRRRRVPGQGEAGTVSASSPWEQEQEAPRGGLRLPWQIKASRK